MDTTNLSLMLVLMMAAMLTWVSVNAILGAIRLNRTYELFPSKFIYPANCSPEHCTDPAGFIAFITPRLWGFGLIGIALSVMIVLNEITGFLRFLPSWFSDGVALFLSIPVFVWYIIFINKAAKRFW